MEEEGSDRERKNLRSKGEIRTKKKKINDKRITSIQRLRGESRWKGSARTKVNDSGTKVIIGFTSSLQSSKKERKFSAFDRRKVACIFRRCGYA